MAANASYKYTEENPDDNLLADDADFMSIQSFSNETTYSTPPSTFDTMTAPNSLMPTSNDSHSISMNAFAGFAGDPTAWGQHAMDFSGVFNANGPPSWAWPNQFGQSGQFNMRNGLTTPPKDDSPHAMTSSQSFGVEVDAVNPSETVNQKKRTAKKMSKASNGSGNGKASGGKPRKTSRIAQAEELEDVEEEGEGGEEGEEGEEKREKFLERNRVAASKCRQKKKAWTNNLEERARELTSQRQMLTAHVAMLRNELLELKCKCLEHTSCDCEQIREYLKNTVAGLQSAPAALYQFQQDDTRRESTTSRVTSNDRVDSNSPYQESRQSSVSADSTLDYLKMEDDVRNKLTESLDPKLGGNGYKN